MFTFLKFLLVAIVAPVFIVESNAVSGQPSYDLQSELSQSNTTIRLKTQLIGVEDNFYHIICRTDNAPTSHVMCHGQDEVSWPTKQYFTVRFRCPGSGSGSSVLSYIQIDIWATTKDVQCRAVEGGLGFPYVVLDMNVQGTTYLKYIANFYSVS